MAINQNKLKNKIQKDKGFFKDFEKKVRPQFDKLISGGVSRNDALKQIRTRIKKQSGDGTFDTISQQFQNRQNAIDENTSQTEKVGTKKGVGRGKTKTGGGNTITDPITGQVTTPGGTILVPGKKPKVTEEEKIVDDTTGDTSVNDTPVDNIPVEDEVVEDTTDEGLTLKQKVANQISGKKTREEILKEERETGGRADLLKLKEGFRTEAASVQTDLDNIKAGLEAEGGAITNIAASRIKEARSAPLREQLVSLVKGQTLTQASITDLDKSIEAIVEARKLDRKEEVNTLSAQIEASNLSDTEKNRLQSELGVVTKRMDREDELEMFRQKEQIKKNVEKADIESLEKTGLTAEQALQSAKITEEFEVKEDSIAGQAIRKLIKEGKTPEQIRKILGLAEDNNGVIDDVVFTRQEKLRKEFESNASVKNYMIAVQQFSGIKQTLASGNGPGDMASIFQFMKILDPSSVVRETEFDAAARSIGVEESLKNFFSPDGKIKGAILTEEGRDQFKAIAKKLFDNRRDAFDERAGKFIRLSKEAGANPRSVVLDFDDVPGFASDLNQEEFNPIGQDSSDDELKNNLRNSGNTFNQDSDDIDIGTHLDEDFKSADQTATTKVESNKTTSAIIDIPTEGFTELANIKRTGTNVGRDTNNPGNITADSIPSGFTKAEYGKRIGASGTYKSPNGREYFIFADTEKGTNALLADVTAKIKGRSANITPNDTLARFQRVYVGQVNSGYLAVLRRMTGANNNTKIKDIDPRKLTEAIKRAEGFSRINS